jgi:hypothetical protein
MKLIIGFGLLTALWGVFYGATVAAIGFWPATFVWLAYLGATALLVVAAWCIATYEG